LRVLYAAFDVVPSPKGAGTHIRHFVAGLTRAGCEVTLLTPLAPGLAAEERYEGARHLRLGTPGAGNFLARALEFAEGVVAHVRTSPPYEVLHYRSLWAGLPALVEARPARLCVFEANSLASLELPFHYPALRGSPTLAKIAALERRLLARSDAVIAVSRVSRAFLIGQGARPESLAVIPNGIDSGEFAPAPLRERDGPRQLLYAGTLADWQGLATALEAMPRILEGVDARLLIVGRGRSRQRKDVLRRIRRLGLEGKVELRPAVPHEQVPALLRECDVALAPLAFDERNVLQGCCPIKVLEAMAAGRPLVASDLPVVRELARPGREALLVPPGSSGALAQAVLRLLARPSLARRLGERAARRAHAELTWARAQERLLALYDARLAAAR